MNTNAIREQLPSEATLAEIINITTFSAIHPEHNGYRIVERLGKPQFNYIDKDGNLVCESWFEEARQFECGFGAVRMGKKWNYLDTQGILLFKGFILEYATDFIADKAIIKCENHFAVLHGDECKLNKSGDAYHFVKVCFLKAEGLEEVEYLANGLFLVTKQDGKVSLANNEGIMKGQWYDTIGDFNRDGWARVTFENNVAIINKGDFL